MQEAVLNGTVLSDGTLQLNQPVPLPPGNVEVVVRARPATGSGVLETLEQIWAASKRAGIVPRTADEIDSEVESIRQAAVEEISEIDEFSEPDEHRSGE